MRLPGCLAPEGAVMLLQTVALGSSLVQIHRFQAWALPLPWLLPEGDPIAVSRKANKPLALD